MRESIENLPFFRCNYDVIDQAFRIAIGDITGNIQPCSRGLLKEPAPCILPDITCYDTSTRNAALYAWNASSLLFPAIMQDTLLSCLENKEQGVVIGGDYYDSIFWAAGAWRHYLCTGHKDFLATAFEAIHHTLRNLEESEFDHRDHLFRGPAAFIEGISGYPDSFAHSNDFSEILEYLKFFPDKKADKGYGIPIKALSTNCLYMHAYDVALAMAHELGKKSPLEWRQKSDLLRESIIKNFWCPTQGQFRYLAEETDSQINQEALGHALVLLFRICEAEQADKILKNQHVAHHGIPCIWPKFSRYAHIGEQVYGRYCGTIHPQISSIWAEAAAMCGRFDLAIKEMRSLAIKACRDSGFSQSYHPDTGEKYAGVEENPAKKSIYSVETKNKITASATGFLNMVFRVLLGMRFSTKGISFNPHIPYGIESLSMVNLPYRNALLHIQMEHSDTEKAYMVLNSKEQNEPFLGAECSGIQQIQIFIPKHTKPK